MITFYGTMQCPDCVDCKRYFDEKGIEYSFKNIEELLILKEFLHLRDTKSIFKEAKEKGSIGIPYIIDGSFETLEYKDITK